MIHHLRGLLTFRHPPTLVIDIQGIGYEIEAPMSTFYQLPELNQEVFLLIHLTIREDAHILYGFSSESERQLFRSLIRINGVGAKLALSILSAMDVATFTHAIHSQKTNQLMRIPGVGKKTAERLLIEMRDRLGPVTDPEITKLTDGITSPTQDAISALIALGYKPQDAERWVKQVTEVGLTSEALIRRALQVAL